MLTKVKRKPSKKFSDLVILIYGVNKIGKSTLCSKAENPLFLETENGLKFLDVYREPILKWEDLVKKKDEIAKEKHDYRPIVIDTIDNAYKMCLDYVCRQCNVIYPSDVKGVGTGWAMVNNEFQRLLNELSILPYGLIMVSHAKHRELKSTAGTYDKAICTLSDGARNIVAAMADLILYCDFDVEKKDDGSIVQKRVIRTKANADYEAGDRGGRMPPTIPMDFNEIKKWFE